MTCCVPKEPLPRFSYQAILLSKPEAERTSASPSPSRSVAYTEEAPSAEVVITCLEPKEPPPLFSYQAILLSKKEAERTSASPSPSRSVAYTE